MFISLDRCSNLQFDVGQYTCQSVYMAFLKQILVLVSTHRLYTLIILSELHLTWMEAFLE